MNDMTNFTWIDYPSTFEKEINAWCDEYAMQMAMDETSVKVEDQWYLAGTHMPHKHCNKIALEGDVPIALMMVVIIESKHIVHFDTLIVNPALRNQKYGTRVLNDILHHAKEIIGIEAPIFVGQIPNNDDVSIKLMDRLGFKRIKSEDGMDDNWHNWIYPPAALGRLYGFD